MAQGNIALLTKGFTAGGTVTQYQPVSPTGGNATAASNAIGFATTGAASGDQFPVVVAGTALAVAGAAISAGALVEVHTTVTKVVTKSAGVAIGRALSAAAADGDVIEVLIIGN